MSFDIRGMRIAHHCAVSPSRTLQGVNCQQSSSTIASLRKVGKQAYRQEQGVALGVHN